jgi:hypothetical protein
MVRQYVRACFGWIRPSSVSVQSLLSTVVRLYIPVPGSMRDTQASGTFSGRTRLTGLESSLSALPFTCVLPDQNLPGTYVIDRILSS